MMQSKDKKLSLKKISFISFCLALTVILSKIKFPFYMPQGGTISLVMLPIFIVSIFVGFKEGFICGLLYGFFDAFFDRPYIFSLLQFILDYILAYSIISFSYYFKRNLFLSIFMGTFLRFLTHFVSGVIFFEIFTKGVDLKEFLSKTLFFLDEKNLDFFSNNIKYFYSFFYNITYIFPQLIICYIIIKFISKNELFLKNIKKVKE